MNIEAFKLYLNHLETYQTYIGYAGGAGLFIAIAGLFTIFIMRGTKGSEEFSYKSKEGHHFHFSSTFAGGLASFGGAMIVIMALYVTTRIAPKIDSEGWKNVAALSTKEVMVAVAKNEGVLGTVKVTEEGLAIAGIFLEKEFAKKVKDRGGDVVELPKERLKVTSSLSTGWTQSEIYFYPVGISNKANESTLIRKALESGTSTLTIEGSPQK